MVIWINGSFGVGKTTVANELVKYLDNSFIYDPENIGAFLRDNLKYGYNDYQEYELWRKFNYEIIRDLSFHYDIVVIPMTLTNKTYYEEIIGRLQDGGIPVRHIILEASEEVIRMRLDKREDTTEWSYQQVGRCLKAFREDIDGYRIDTTNKDVKDIVNTIVGEIKNI